MRAPSSATEWRYHHERRYPNRSPRHRNRRPLEVADPTKNLILVPLSQLLPRRSKRNACKTPRLSIPELAAGIARIGLLQSLVSKHHRARDVMTQVHWKNNNYFIHYGGAGIDMFDTSGSGQGALAFEFDDVARNSSISALLEQILRYV